MSQGDSRFAATSAHSRSVRVAANGSYRGLCDASMEASFPGPCRLSSFDLGLAMVSSGCTGIYGNGDGRRSRACSGRPPAANRVRSRWQGNQRGTRMFDASATPVSTLLEIGMRARAAACRVLVRPGSHEPLRRS